MKNIINIWIVLSSCLSLQSCTLDPFLFNSAPLDAYRLSNEIIADSLREEIIFDSEGNTLYGFFVRQADIMRVDPHPVIIYHHGNRDNIEFYWHRVELLWRIGFDVFVYDYRGFGKSTGASSETGLYADAEAAYRYVRSRSDVDTLQIVQYGYSLGGVPALHLAADVTNPKAVILESCFATGEDLVQSGTLLDIPGGYLLEGEFNNVAKVGEINAPLLMLHGVDDRFIDINRNGTKLYQAAVNPKSFIRVSGAGHDNVPQTIGEQAYIDIIRTFVRGS